jgi:prepilin-type N-terminal cleavage/methylation domain-containing protein
MKNEGFTMIETIIVLVIASLLLLTSLLSFTTQIDISKNARTKAMLEQIREILISHYIVTEALPCPANPNERDPSRRGLPDDVHFCDQQGEIPWKLFGISEKYDAWSNKIKYQRFDQAMNEVIRVEGTPLGADTVAAVLLSYGKNKKPDGRNAGHYPPYEHKAYTPDVNLSTQDKKAFDDILVWISQNTLAKRVTDVGKKWQD